MKKAKYILSTVSILAMSLSSCSNIPNETIGNQVLMIENLNVDEFRNGDPIPEVKTEKDWKKAGDNQQPAWCYYDNDPSNGEKYGKLYNWYAVNDPRGLAPAGWHIIDKDELDTLFNFLGGKLVAGGKMKSNSGWEFNGLGINGTNESNFFGLPGGYRSYKGGFKIIDAVGMWWTSESTGGKDNAYLYKLSCKDSVVVEDFFDKGCGLSVRCIRD